MNNKNAKIIYIIVLILIVAVAAVYGIRRNLNFIPTISIGGISSDEDREQENGSDTVMTGEFNEIDVKTSVARISVAEGTEFKVYYEYSGPKGNHMCPEVSCENGKLSVNQKYKNFNIGRGVVNRHCEITIYVPAGTKLGTVNINTDVGDVEWENIDFEDGEFTSNVGNISIEDATCDKAKLTSNVGDVETTEIVADSIDMTSDVGKIKVSKCTVNAVYGSSDVGDVRVDDTKKPDGGEPRYDLDTDVGEVRIDGSKKGKSYRN